MKQDVLDNELYKEAEKYRDSFAHYTGPSNVNNMYTIQKHKEVEFPELQEDGTTKLVKKKATVLSCKVGEYTYVEDIMKNILEFSEFTSEKIYKVLQDMIAE